MTSSIAACAGGIFKVRRCPIPHKLSRKLQGNSETALCNCRLLSVIVHKLQDQTGLVPKGFVLQVALNSQSNEAAPQVQLESATA